MRKLRIDLETFSDKELSGTKGVGLYNYVQSELFEILLFGFACDDGAPVVVDLASGEHIPHIILQALRDPRVIKTAFNAAFEWYCLSKHLDLNPVSWISQWRDTQLQTLYCGMSDSLAVCSEAALLGAESKKSVEGTRLITKFCKPKSPTKTNIYRTRIYPKDAPEDWERFKAYNAQDIVAERALDNKLSQFEVPESIHKQWQLAQVINLRGVQADLPFIRQAQKIHSDYIDVLELEFRKLTGIPSAKAVAQLKNWCNMRIREDSPSDPEPWLIPDLRKDTVADLLKGEYNSKTPDGRVETVKVSLPFDVVRALELRKEIGKTSIAKYGAMERMACSDSRMRGVLQFYGASRTGRESGRGIQPQNLPRTYLKNHADVRKMIQAGRGDAISMLYRSTTDTLSQMIRTAIVAPEGKTFVDADFSAIEARVIAWLAGEEWRLNVFREGKDIYKASYAQMFDVSVDDVTSDQRQQGKVAELALGYNGGPNALTKMDFNNVLADDAKPGIVRRWREASPMIFKLWHSFQDCAVTTIKTGRSTEYNGVRFSMEVCNSDPALYFMTIQLHNGVKLYYARPVVVPGEKGDRIVFWGVHQETRQWTTLETYGGKLTENVVQALARHCLYEGAILRAEEAGLPVVFHVHDEVICEVEAAQGEQALAKLQELTSNPIPWALDLPLRGEGWVGKYYRKE